MVRLCFGCVWIFFRTKNRCSDAGNSNNNTNNNSKNSWTIKNKIQIAKSGILSSALLSATVSLLWVSFFNHCASLQFHSLQSGTQCKYLEFFYSSFAEKKKNYKIFAKKQINIDTCKICMTNQFSIVYEVHIDIQPRLLVLKITNKSLHSLFHNRTFSIYLVILS